MPLLGRRPTGRTPPVRALVASARTLQVGNERDALSIRRTRQPWQPAAWTYRDSIGEIGYAMRFLANSLSRMRLYAAAYEDPMENPVPIGEANNIPDDVAKLADAAIAELGAGQLALSGLIKPLVENMEVVGECYLVSDPANIDQLWSIRSMDEIQVLEDGEFLLRDDPDQRLASVMPQGKPLSNGAYIARMWTPHPRFHAWADSPMRQLVDTCDELLLLSRSVRAIARSRLTGPGILAVAEELSLTRQGNQETDDDPLADVFMRELTDAMMEPIGDEGSAASVVPIVVRGPFDMIEKGIQHFAFDRILDTKAVELRSELIGRLATGIDLPKEVITGTADLNHWSSWQIDDNTFRHHVEPKVLTMVDCLTVAYLRVRLLADNVPEEVVNRIVVWYDPTELVTHPDRTKDALDIWDRFGISTETLRDVAGWSEDDAPTHDEVLLRMLFHLRTLPPNAAEGIMHRFDPTLMIPADNTEPGVGPDGETPPAGGQAPPPAGSQPNQPTQGPPPQAPPPAAPSDTPKAKMQASGTVQFASPVRVTSRQSRRLMDIDRSLRERLVAASDAAVRRTLERAGNRARAKTPNAVRLSLAGIPAADIPATLGPAKLAEYGLDEEALLADTFDQLKASWSSWVDAAQRAALGVAMSIAGLRTDDQVVQDTRRRQEQATEAGWTALAAALGGLAHRLLFDPHPDHPDLTPADVGKTVVPHGVVRKALAVAGGATDAPATGVPTGGAAVPVPGITSGPTIGGLMTDSGATIAGYEWVHGDAVHPYEPHEALDGYTFTDWADPGLVPGDDANWLGVGDMFPSDHDGCTCEVLIDWIEPSTSAEDGG